MGDLVLSAIPFQYASPNFFWGGGWLNDSPLEVESEEFCILSCARLISLDF